MVNLNETFLAELGLDGLHPQHTHDLLRKVECELEMRVGEELSQGMSDELLDEFDQFVNHKRRDTIAWLDANAPNWQTNPDLPPGVGHDNPYDLAAMLWLRIHRPDYPSVVADKLNDIKLELMECRDAIRAQYVG